MIGQSKKGKELEREREEEREPETRAGNGNEEQKQKKGSCCGIWWKGSERREYEKRNEVWTEGMKKNGAKKETFKNE